MPTQPVWIIKLWPEDWQPASTSLHFDVHEYALLLCSVHLSNVHVHVHFPPRLGYHHPAHLHWCFLLQTIMMLHYLKLGLLFFKWQWHIIISSMQLCRWDILNIIINVYLITLIIWLFSCKMFHCVHQLAANFACLWFGVMKVCKVVGRKTKTISWKTLTC